MKQIIHEGTWFALPLRSRGFGVGLVARSTSPGGIVLAYFFAKMWKDPPSLNDVNAFRPESAIRVLRVGDLGLMNGSWIVLGRDPEWQRDEWPIPNFVRRDALARRAWIVRYSDFDINIVESETPIVYDHTTLSRESVLGFGAAEIVLTEALEGASKDPVHR